MEVRTKLCIMVCHLCFVYGSRRFALLLLTTRSLSLSPFPSVADRFVFRLSVSHPEA